MKTISKGHCPTGFTIIELMVAIAISAILLMVAAPSFVSYQRNSELTSATNSLISGISVAKSESMKRGISTVIIPASGGDWATGWRIFVDSDRDRVFNAGNDILINEQKSLALYFSTNGTGTASGSGAYIMFDPSGYTKTASAGFGAVNISLMRNDISGADLLEETRRVIVSASGRIRSCKPSTDTTCTTAATE